MRKNLAVNWNINKVRMPKAVFFAWNPFLCPGISEIETIFINVQVYGSQEAVSIIFLATRSALLCDSSWLGALEGCDGVARLLSPKRSYGRLSDAVVRRRARQPFN